MSPNAGGGGVVGSQPMRTAVYTQYTKWRRSVYNKQEKDKKKLDLFQCIPFYGSVNCQLKTKYMYCTSVSVKWFYLSTVITKSANADKRTIRQFCPHKYLNLWSTWGIYLIICWKTGEHSSFLHIYTICCTGEGRVLKGLSGKILYMEWNNSLWWNMPLGNVFKKKLHLIIESAFKVLSTSMPIEQLFGKTACTGQPYPIHSSYWLE